MGFDIKAALDGVVAFVSQNHLLVLAGLGLLVLFSSKGVFARIRHGIEKALTDNWQLTLLASTGIALSLASGYTTFDGLRNFTSAPLLSIAISFGVQGVMLIVAWLIGESFAVGMNQRAADGRRVRLVDATVGMLLGVAFVGIVFYWLLNQYDAVTVTNTGFRADMVRFVDVSVYFLLGLVLVGLAAFGFRRGGEISTPYVQSLRLIMKNAVLWVMLIASMTASVFFSFDSHFNAIFPQEARKRAAEIRTTNQIGAAVADIGALTQKRQIEEAENLFGAEGWKAYESQLIQLAHAAQGAQAEIEQYFVQKLEERRRAINQQQERIATSQSGQAGLAVKKLSLTEELSRLKAERPGLAAEYAQHKSELDAKAKEIDAKRVEGMAEDRGVEGTLKQGKGPVYRERMAELGTLQDQYKIKQERTKDAQKRLVAAETRIAQIERELSIVGGDLAKLKGDAETAEQRIKTAQSAGSDDEGARLDPARVLPAFERARAAFRQQPDTARLAALQQQCASLLNAMSSTPATKDKVRAIDCDPKQAADAAARVFALNAGLVAFSTSCAGGDKLAQHTSTDSLLAFGRKCLQDSGLISKDSADVGARLSAIDMNRDDKAHRFVVTWNAFLDGNRLAYLALTLAIGVDALVFMSGLFGAQALRSPLSDVPSPKARSAEQLEAIIKNALGEERLENAELVLAAMHPLSGQMGYHAAIDLASYDSEVAQRIRKVLVAGSSIGAIKHASTAPGEERYFVRSELFEYLSVVANTARESDSEYANRKRLIQIVGVALEPDRKANAEVVLRYVEPINPRHGFMAKVELGTVDEGERRLVQDVLNAGMTLHAVQRHESARLAARFMRSAAAVDTTFFIRTDLFKTLLLYRAGSSALLDQRGPDRQLESPQGGRSLHRLASESDPLPRVLGNGHGKTNGNGATNGIRHDLETYFRERLLEPLKLTSASLDRIWNGEIAAEAKLAALALKRLAHANTLLEEELRLAESETLRDLEHARDQIADERASDPQALEVLYELVAQLRGRISAVMLLPEGRLVDRLISALEDAGGGGGLTDQEDLLLDRLKKLKGKIKLMNLSDASSWKRLTRELERLSDPSMPPPVPLN
jgi:hypothetical protein